MQEDSDYKKKQKEQEKALKEAREKAAKGGPLGNISTLPSACNLMLNLIIKLAA